MVPLTGECIELSVMTRNEMASQTPGGGPRSPAAGPAPGPSAELSLSEGQTEASVPAAPTVVPPRLSRWGQLRQSVWAPVLLKVGGASVGLFCLAWMGSLSMARGPLGSVPVTAHGTEWLAGAAAPEPRSVEAAGTPLALASVESSAESGSPAEHEGQVAKGPPGPEPPPCVAPTEPPQAKGGQGVTADGRIILNQANVAELTRLPGIGQRRAEQILSLRERLGKFKRVTDLLRVKGIGPKSLRQLAPLVVLDPPKDAPPTDAAM